MLIEKVGEAVLAKVADAMVARVAERWGARESGLRIVKVSDPRILFKSHLRMIYRWACEISFRDLNKAKRLQTNFVDLDLDLGHTERSTITLPGSNLRISDIARLREHIILLGDPGAGKTTSLKRIALHLLEEIGSGNTRLLLLITLRAFPTSDSLAANILSVLGITSEPDAGVDETEARNLRRRLALRHLNEAEMTVLIDGVDEVQPRPREGVIEDLRYFLLNSGTNSDRTVTEGGTDDAKTRFIVTCRTGDFRYHLENSAVLSIRPLSSDQIAEFAGRWLGTERSKDFLDQIRSNPYRGTEVRPLTLAHLCAIFERSGTVPEKPRTVYKKIVRLLLEEWDEQRSIRRVSRYGNFEVDRKEEFLQAIAFHLTLLNAQGRFSHTQLEAAYRSVHESFALPASEAGKVVREIESHTGLIMEIAFETYEFAHKSIQEYLTAAFALRLSRLPRELFASYPNEVALAVALSADPNEYFSAVVNHILGLNITFETQGIVAEFVEPFLRRLALEKVDFRAGFAFGENILQLVSATYKGAWDTFRQLHFTSQFEISDPTAILDFLTQPVVAMSAATVLRSANISRVDNDLFYVNVQSSPSSEHPDIILHPDVILAVDDGEHLDWMRSTNR